MFCETVSDGEVYLLVSCFTDEVTYMTWFRFLIRVTDTCL